MNLSTQAPGQELLVLEVLRNRRASRSIDAAQFGDSPDGAGIGEIVAEFAARIPTTVARFDDFETAQEIETALGVVPAL